MLNVRCLIWPKPCKPKTLLIDRNRHAGIRLMPPFVASRDRNLTQASKATKVLARFGLRIAAVVAFAVFGGIGFQRGLTVMLWMSAILCAVVATFDREDPLGSVLNHWDEAMAYAALCCLASTFEPAL
jgi:hypothetical protein